MLTPDQIRRRASKRYEEFLRSLCTGEALLPLAVFGSGLSRPNDFATDRAAIEALRSQSKEQAGFGYAITWKEHQFRRLGLQKVPDEVVFPTQNDFVRFLGKSSEVRQFQADYDLIVARCPELRSWAQAKPLKVVHHAGAWEGLLNVCGYLKEHPRPDCYLRELPVVADTKFIERHTGVLAELLPVVAPATVGPDVSRFETRFGFRFKQPMVRARLLDPALAGRLGFPVSDFATPLDQFRGLPVADVVVLIVENEMTFLTLPVLPKTIAIWGSGDAATMLTTVAWLNQCRLLYWGDLDSHGFETLAQLRTAFPSIQSVLMDERTFDTHAGFAVKASPSTSQKLLELTQEERAIYHRLIETGLLLEQERIPNCVSGPELLRGMQAVEHPTFEDAPSKGSGAVGGQSVHPPTLTAQALRHDS
ncbi:MAG: hypothetical protein FD161_1213 [Limisphaerales bacterium]|nr:MAG: hypothetical protein FD161_1213 [Limisphaerales bacterium]TXT49483.1 MAG: hypothetical protein FD140_3015 [Limisphaerales bacterium]